MEPEGSLLCSQEPSTARILSKFNPVHNIPSYLRTILILSIYLRLGLPSGLFPSGFPTNIVHFSSPSFVLHSLHVGHIEQLNLLTTSYQVAG
jgi:hypothetical protein